MYIATVVTTLSNTEGEETFEESSLGSAEEIYEEAVGDNDFVFIKGPRQVKAVSILLRGPNEMMIDECER